MRGRRSGERRFETEVMQKAFGGGGQARSVWAAFIKSSLQPLIFVFINPCRVSLNKKREPNCFDSLKCLSEKTHRLLILFVFGKIYRSCIKDKAILSVAVK